MLNLKTLANKPNFTKPNGDVVVDLIRRAVSFLGVRLNTGKAYVVSEETAMRPDLIANYFYQNQGYADLLLKYNGYSNPFSINTGDIIRIPSSEDLNKFGSVGASTGLGGTPAGLTGIRKKPTNVVLAPKTRKDKARLAYLLQRGNAVSGNLAKLESLLKSGNFTGFNGQLANIIQGGNFSGTGPLTSAYQAANSAPVPPNVALDSGVKLANGKIIFGSDVTNVKKEDCPEPVSRAKLKETLIKNKLA
jgi:hypothetical protein